MRAKAYIKALPSLLQRQDIEDAYRIYVTDTLRYIAANTANFGGGSYPEVRYYDLVRPEKEETRTEAEIIAQVKKAWGGEEK